MASVIKFTSKNAATGRVTKGNPLIPMIFGRPAPTLSRHLLRRAKRSAGRPQKTDAIRTARLMKAEGLNLRAIANSALMQRLLGRRVSDQRVSQLLRAEPKGLPPWLRDLDVIRWWCRGLGRLTENHEVVDPEFSAFWEAEVLPLLLAHPDLYRAGGDHRGREQAFAGPEKGLREVELRELQKTQWQARHPSMARAEKRAHEWRDRREWRLTVRSLIAQYLWERSEEPSPRRLRSLADRFGLSERQVRRVVVKAV